MSFLDLFVDSIWRMLPRLSMCAPGTLCYVHLRSTLSLLGSSPEMEPSQSHVFGSARSFSSLSKRLSLPTRGQLSSQTMWRCFACLAASRVKNFTIGCFRPSMTSTATAIVILHLLFFVKSRHLKHQKVARKTKRPPYKQHHLC